jgi:hypothetical protein
VAPQYAALLVGVLFQPFFDAFQQSQAWDFRWQWVLFALIVTFAIFPAVYRRAWDPDKPMFVQLCTIFSAGLGWQSLLAIGAKSVT